MQQTPDISYTYDRDARATGSATRSSVFGARPIFVLRAEDDDGNAPAQVFFGIIFGFHSRQTRTDTGAATTAGTGAGAGGARS
jgi:hypothetical protein